MNNFDKEYGNPVVDFDYFRLKTVSNNREAANKLALALAANINIDDLLFDSDEDYSNFDTTVGSGGSGMTLSSKITETTQRLALASHLSSYAEHQYSSCYLALPEYRCLRNLRDYLVDNQENYHSQHPRMELINQLVHLLNEVISEFAKNYSDKDSSFLLTVIKETQ